MKESGQKVETILLKTFFIFTQQQCNMAFPAAIDMPDERYTFLHPFQLLAK